MRENLPVTVQVWRSMVRINGVWARSVDDRRTL